MVTAPDAQVMPEEASSRMGISVHPDRRAEFIWTLRYEAGGRRGGGGGLLALGVLSQLLEPGALPAEGARGDILRSLPRSISDRGYVRAPWGFRVHGSGVRKRFLPGLPCLSSGSDRLECGGRVREHGERLRAAVPDTRTASTVYRWR